MKPLSPTGSMFLWMETRSQPMHVAGLNLYTPAKGAGPDYLRRLVEGWRQHLQAVPPFNQRPVLKLGRWYWEADQDFELDYHLRHVALPQPGRIRELLAMASRVHGNLLDRNRPLWEAYVIEGLPGGRFDTYIKVHHALVDGVSGAKMMADGLSRSAAEMKPPLWAQTFGKRAAAPGGTRVDRLVKSAVEAARATGEILPGVGSGLWELVHSSQAAAGATTPYEAPATPFNTEITGSRRFAAQSYSLERLRQIGKATGATVNDVTLAICAGALRRHLLSHSALPKTPLTAMVPVSLHGDPSAGAEGGNQVALLLANLATHIADPVKRLQRIVASTTAAKQQLSKMSRLQKIAHGAAMLARQCGDLAVPAHQHAGAGHDDPARPEERRRHLRRRNDPEGGRWPHRQGRAALDRRRPAAGADRARGPVQQDDGLGARGLGDARPSGRQACRLRCVRSWQRP